LQCEPNDDISKEHQRAAVDIVQAIESIPVFRTVQQVVGAVIGGGVSGGCPMANGWPSCCTERAHYLTMLILFWPYPELVESRGARLQKLVDEQMEGCAAVGCQLLCNEVHQLRQQFQSVLGYVNRCCKCHCSSSSNTPPVAPVLSSA